MADAIWRWDATRTADAIARRQISSREAVDACLARTAAVNSRRPARAVVPVTIKVEHRPGRLRDHQRHGGVSRSRGHRGQSHGCDLGGGVMFSGHLYREGDLVALARAYQDLTGQGTRQPARFAAP